MVKIGSSIGLALLCVLSAPAAGAQPDDWIAAYGPTACQWMDQHPDLYGSLSTMRAMQDAGVAVQEIPGALAAVITTYCPNHADLFNRTRRYLTHGGGGGGIGVVGMG